MLNVVMVSVIMLNVIMLSIVMLNVVMLSVVMLIVAVPPKLHASDKHSSLYVLSDVEKKFNTDNKCHSACLILRSIFIILKFAKNPKIKKQY
jgi:hypothetical protein